MEIFLRASLLFLFRSRFLASLIIFRLPCLITYVEIPRRRTVQHSFAVLYAAIKWASPSFTLPALSTHLYVFTVGKPRPYITPRRLYQVFCTTILFTS